MGDVEVGHVKNTLVIIGYLMLLISCLLVLGFLSETYIGWYWQQHGQETLQLMMKKNVTIVSNTFYPLGHTVTTIKLSG